MNPLIAIAISEGLAALIKIWAVHADKPEGWKPTAEDWDALLALNEKTAADYKAQAAAQMRDKT